MGLSYERIEYVKPTFLFYLFLCCFAFADREDKHFIERSPAVINRPEYISDPVRFKKQIDYLVQKLGDKEFERREEAQDSLHSLLYRKELGDEQRDYLLKSITHNKTTNPETRKRLASLTPITLDGRALENVIIKHLETNSRLNEYRDILDLIFSNISDEEHTKYLQLLVDEQNAVDAVKQVQSSIKEKIRRFKIGALDEFKKPAELKKDDPLFEDLKASYKDVKIIQEQKNQVIADILDKKGFKTKTILVDNASIKLKEASDDEDEKPAEEDKQVGAFNKKYHEINIPLPKPEIAFEKNSKKYQLDLAVTGSFEVSNLEKFKDELNPLEDYLKKSEKYIYLPNYAKHSDLKKIASHISLIGTFDNPAFIARFDIKTADNSTGNLYSVRNAAEKIINEQFNFSENSKRQMKEFTIVRSERPAMKDIQVDKKNLDFLPYKALVEGPAPMPVAPKRGRPIPNSTAEKI